MTEELAFGVGLVAGADLDTGAQAARVALAGLPPGARPDLAAVFIGGLSGEIAASLLQRVAAELDAHHVIGCTAGSVLGGGHALEDTPAVGVWVATLPGVSVRSFHLEVLRTDTEVAVLGMPERRLDEIAGVLLADPWSFPVEGFLERSDLVMPGLSLVGGLASQAGGPGTTRLLIDGRVVDRGAAGVLLGGAVEATSLVSQGARPVGPAMVVTRAEGGTIGELAGRPAFERLDEVLAGLGVADSALAAQGLLLGVALDEYADSHDAGDFLIRGLLGGDRDSGTLELAEELTVGQTVRFHLRDAATAAADLTAALEAVREDVLGALVFSCNGRGESFFGAPGADAAAVAALPGSPALAGFLAAGEVGPAGGRNRLHTLTASILLFERPAPDLA